MRILVVEDETKIAQALKEGLGREGFSITLSASGEDAFFSLQTESFDLVLLDLMLPGRSGFEILKALRNRDRKLPVLILTAKDALEDKVAGFDSGADDYLVKPFAFPELVARVRSLLRRVQESETATTFHLDDLSMDYLKRIVRRLDTALDLTKREYEILELLSQNHGRIVSREMLARDVWKETSRATPLDNVIDVHFARLRKKVDTGFKTKLLHTIRGVGFKLDSKGEE
jgi:two-component system, OmpR family, copper resistance phosphate regulon response regulator CusR